LNLRPPGYEPDELPGCSTPRYRKCGESESSLIVYDKKVHLSTPFIRLFYGKLYETFLRLSYLDYFAQTGLQILPANGIINREVLI
jgi:hypothetical protein